MLSLLRATSAGEDPGIRLLRYTLAVLMIIHGLTRIAVGGVTPFGGYLSSVGFPLGVALAWSITLFEIVGTVTLTAGYFLIPISLVFCFQLLMGIILVHGREGWFVVGAGRNGMEYSVLLIFGFLAVVCSTWMREKRREP